MRNPEKIRQEIGGQDEASAEEFEISEPFEPYERGKEEAKSEEKILELERVSSEILKILENLPTQEQLQEAEEKEREALRKFFQGGSLEDWHKETKDIRRVGSVEMSGLDILAEMMRRLKFDEKMIKQAIEHEEAHVRESQKLGLKLKKISIRFFRTKEGRRVCIPSTILDLPEEGNEEDAEKVRNALRDTAAAPSELSEGDLDILRFSEEAQKKEIKNGQEDDQEIERAKRKLGEIFDNNEDGQARVKNILSIIGPFLNSDLIDGKGVQRSLKECSTVKERDEFIKKVLSSIEPVIELRNKNPEAFREIQGQENFTDLKEVLSYGLSEDKGLIHIHLVEVKEKKKGRVTRDRLEKDLKQLAKMIVENEEFKEVKKITATSWIVAKYPRATERIGFTLGDEVSEEDRENHYREIPKDTPIRRASITREEFLKRYLEK